MPADTRRDGDTPSAAPAAQEAPALEGPRPAAGGKDAPAAAPAAPGGRGSRFATALALLALAGVLAVSAAAYLAWQRLEASAAALADAAEASARRLQAEIEALSARVEGNSAALSGQASGEQALRGAVDRLEHALGETRDTLREEMAELSGTAKPAMEPVDVERLLLIAGDALALRRDPDTALEAMRTADRRLRALDDPAYGETRRLLAAEIVALEAAPRADVAGMAYLLAGLQEQVRGLTPRIGPAAGEQDGAAPPEAEPDGGQPSWRTFLADLGQALRGLVVIRRTGAEEGPLLAPEQEALLAQNLYLKLESARLALLAGDARNFHLGVRDARSWLAEYYRADDPAVAALIARLEELDRAELQPPLPEVSGSLAALRAAMERRRSARAGGAQAGEAAGPGP